ncbi:hypothetical protein V2J09_003384 [Rumex salicifolius]
MFYSHQLLARKAPMGQIWMAATMHAKMSKKKLSKIDIIQICDEILNPKVPMALRLSSILMGGVVIVYERKIKLNEAWKVKLVDDPNILPLGKRQAKPEAVTLSNQHCSDIGEMEQFMDCSTSKSFPAVNFHASAYFTMNLDAVDELAENLREEDLTHQHHQGRNTAQNARTEASSPSGPQGSKDDFQDPQIFFDGGHSGFTSGSHASIEAHRAVPAVEGNFIPPEVIIGTGSAHNTTPNRNGNDLTTLLSQASLGSVHRSFTNNSEGNTRSSKKRPHSSSHNNNSGLRTVVENPIDAEMEHEPNFFINEEFQEPNFKLVKDLTPENAYTNMTPLLEETGRTQTQRPVANEEMENTTTIIRTHLKTYFEGPEAPQSESLDQLADGMNRKQAAQLFFQICVLVTREVLKVKQTEPYGDILISRGAKM